VMTPMKIESTTAPLITMYPKDFTLHNMTAFVGGGELVDAKFQVSGNVSQIADFVNVTEFTYHATVWGMPDPSPAYFKPNMTAVIGDTLNVGSASAPTMLFAELQVYIAENTPLGAYTGKVELLNGTTVIASTDLSFEVRMPKQKVLWEDYFNSYTWYWSDCERLWGGAFWGSGVFEWWKLVSQAGFDVDSLHQQLHFNEHLGFFGSDAKDPMQVIAYGGYNTLFMDDVDFQFSYLEISVFQGLYESGKMNFVIMFNSGSEAIDMFTTNYGISINMPYMGGTSYPPSISDLLITGVDKTHPIFKDVENFTLSMYPYEGCYFLRAGPFIYSEGLMQSKGTPKGIATGTDDFGLVDTSGFVVAVNELQATSHITSRMVVTSGGNMLETLEYEDYIIWINLYMLAQENPTISRVDTDRFAVNMLDWLNPQFANQPPVIDHTNVSPTTTELGETVNIDVVTHDPEGDSFTVAIAVQKPDNTWDNATVSPVGGHWLRSFTTDLEGKYEVYAVAADSYGATTSMLCGTVKAVNMPPEIVWASISPSTVTKGENVFVTLNTKDLEDGAPTNITITVTTPNGTSYNYNFTNVSFVTAIFDTTDKPEGVYQITATLKDSNGALTTANIGHFEVKVVAAGFPIREATLGIGVAGLILLIIAVLLMFMRLPGKPKTP